MSHLLDTSKTRPIVLIDIHTHTFPRSDDSLVSPEELMSRAKRAGLEGICLTEHDVFWPPIALEQLSKEYGVTIFPGCEVTTEEGHLLVFGLDRYVFGMHRAAFVRDLVNRAGGVIVLAHPYRRVYRAGALLREGDYGDMIAQTSHHPVISLVDAVEVFNGRGSEEENGFAAELSRRSNLKGIGGSDSHQLTDIGTYATEFAHPVRNVVELVQEIKAGRFRPVALAKGCGSLYIERK